MSRLVGMVAARTDCVRWKSMAGFVLASALLMFGMTRPAAAWVGMPVEKLHVSGNKLVDPNGRVVLLHGWHQPTDPYFAGDGRYFNSPTDYAGALTYFDAIVDTLTDTSPHYGFDHGWYCNYVRFAPDKYWFGDYADGSFSMQRLQAFTNNLLIPFVNHCRQRGVYVVIFPNVSVNSNSTTSQLQSALKTIWGYWASTTGLRGADNVQFELMNEPINALASDGTWGGDQPKYWQAFTQWIQPVVNTIRATGADNVIWVPGLGWQSQYAGFVTWPVNGGTVGNIGYAAHFYPQYGGIGDNPSAVASYWASNYKPCADRYPMVITEMYWDRFMTGDNPYDQLFNGVTGDDSFGFGTAMRHVVDASNVGWAVHLASHLLTGGPNTDMGDPDGGLNYTPSRDDSALAAFNWFYQYSDMGPTAASVSAFARIEAQRYDAVSGAIQMEACLEGTQDMGFIQSGNYAVYRNVDFGTGANRFIARIAGFGGRIQMRVGSPTGTLLGDFAIPNTGGWQNWRTVEFPIAHVSGKNNVYLVFQPQLNLHWFRFDFVAPNVAVTVSNAGFETPSLGAGNYAYAPANATWTFTAAGTNVGAGISANGTGFTTNNPNAPEGAQVAFVQSTGATSVTVPGLPYDGMWTIQFWAAQRKLRSGFGQTISVCVDGKPIGLASPITLGYDLFTLTARVSAGSHTLTFVGTSSTDDTAFIDGIAITGPPLPPPAPPLGVSAKGGANSVALGWSPSALATSYNVYMGTSAGHEASVPVMKNITDTGTTIAGLQAGKTYYFTATGVDSSGESARSTEVSATTLPAITLPVITLNSGLELVSSPYTYASGSFADILGVANPTLYAWQSDMARYVAAPTPPADRFTPGVGYWVRLAQPGALKPGIPGDYLPSVQVALTRGWNLIGDPYLESVPLSALTFDTGGSVGVLWPVIWKYDATENGGTGGYATASQLDPGLGYWVYASRSCVATIPNVGL